MPTNDAWTGAPVPIGSDVRNVPTQLAALVASMGRGTIPEFASEAERDAAVVASGSPARRGMEAFIDALGYTKFYDGTIWRPRSGQRLARVNPAVSPVTVTTGTAGATVNGNLLSYPFPVEVEIRWGIAATQAGASDQWDGIVWVNGAAPGLTGVAKRGFGAWMSVSDVVRWDRAANDAAATFQVVFTKVAGSGSSSTLNDNKYTYCEAIVRAI